MCKHMQLKRNIATMQLATEILWNHAYQNSMIQPISVRWFIIRMRLINSAVKVGAMLLGFSPLIILGV